MSNLLSESEYLQICQEGIYTPIFNININKITCCNCSNIGINIALKHYEKYLCFDCVYNYFQRIKKNIDYPYKN